MNRLQNKVIIVTGGTQGVGEAIAIHAARQGAAGVVICGRQADKGQQVVARIESEGAAGLFVPADLSVV
ncbi:MAG TPA: SDR family NAD(P)-dependent oxidoreductase, partial [Planctomycetaceae bacterium]|nr:SDR family NAD(P)-dependent oxidoreductase [Planctomycetaceae bacterium]